MQKAILVIDIGMTNKKVAVYDEKLNLKELVYKSFEPILVQDPLTKNQIPSYDLESIKNYFAQEIKTFATKYQIEAISVSTHGATAVCIDKEGNQTVPCIFYTYDPDEKSEENSTEKSAENLEKSENSIKKSTEFQKEFYKLCGNPKTLQKETLTPRLSALINLAKGIFFAKTHFPQLFEKTQTILNFPQYWTYLLTGKKLYEQTFLACHTYLLNHQTNEWSNLAQKLQIQNKLPQDFVPTCSSAGKVLPQVAKKLGLSENVIVAAGIHDSNASLLPYLLKSANEDFILNSTGSWCVLLHPLKKGEKAFCSDDEIGKAVFFNKSALNQPVKTSIFLGGIELDFYVKLFNFVNQKNEFPSSDFQEIQKILSEKNVFILPESVVENEGEKKFGIVENNKFYSKNQLSKILQSKKSSESQKLQKSQEIPLILKDEKKFFATLVLSLAIQTEISLNQLGIKKGTLVFTEGGFRKNLLYNKVLASIFPENDFYLTNIQEATSLGAAITAILAAKKSSLEELSKYVLIEKTKILPEKISSSDYEEYKKLMIKQGEKYE